MAVELTPLDYLKSIDLSLMELVRIAKAKSDAAPASKPATVTTASDADLESKYGDPVINAKDPRDWHGETMKGRRMSECPPDYLSLYADRLDYFAEKADDAKEVTSGGKPKAPYLRKDAARARGWAARLRSGWKAPQGTLDADDRNWPAELEPDVTF